MRLKSSFDDIYAEQRKYYKLELQRGRQFHVLERDDRHQEDV